MLGPRVISRIPLISKCSPHSGLFDLAEHIDEGDAPALKTALADSMQSTQELITSFMQIGTKTQPAVLQDNAYQDCQKAQNEVFHFFSTTFHPSLTKSYEVHCLEI